MGLFAFFCKKLESRIRFRDKDWLKLMVKRNCEIARLKSGYLFPEIHRRRKEFQAANPKAHLISLGIGDTTEPIPPTISHALSSFAEGLGTIEGYRGYGAEQGSEILRSKVASVVYRGLVSAQEVFISDGAKCDIGRLQTLFGPNVSIAVQDPVYPVYIDGSIIHGVKNIELLPCLPENGFFPDLRKAPRTDLIYFCSPNNPTGAVATKEQLKELVDFARKNRSIIIFDSAYSCYIKDKRLPTSIFEIPGAREVALEVSSFSKIAGFTGVRLGWTVIPEELLFDDGQSVKADWNRLTTTIFNGASNIAQQGGIAVLESRGLKEIMAIINFYMENAHLIKEALQDTGLQVFGGDNAPYLWAWFKGKNSWDVFHELLHQLHIVATPGAGFGPSGEGFVRFSAFGHRENILIACERLRQSFKLGMHG
jgi:LL-diaminopimelate aminotransferase